MTQRFLEELAFIAISIGIGAEAGMLVAWCALR